jgi:voltage-gated potassium channel
VLFPVGRLFSIAFANLIAVYAAIFSLFVEEVFKGVDPDILSIAFSLPIFAFVAGCWFRREQVRAVVAHPAIRSERRMLGAFLSNLHRRWFHATAVPRGRAARQHGRSADRRHDSDRADRVHGEPRRRHLVDAGLLFEEFFFRIQRLVVPAFASLTFYSLLIILFASAYHTLSQYTGTPISTSAASRKR